MYVNYLTMAKILRTKSLLMALELSVPSSELDGSNWVLIRYWYYLG
jgi:hypothetical protein